MICPLPDQGIIIIENGASVFLQGFNQFPLTPGNHFLRSCPFGVDCPDICNDTNMRAGDITQETNFTRDIKPHFQHGTLVAGTKPQQGKGQSNLIVQVAKVFQVVVPLAEDIRHQFLCS